MSDEDVRTEPIRSAPVEPAPARRPYAVYAGVLLLAFLLGFIPMWLRARACDSSLAQAERQLALAGMHGSLASAALDARRGDYEPARQTASQFFTSLRAEIDKADGSNFTQAQRQAVQPLFDGRDEVITLLARSDPASADRLADLYAAYRRATGG